MSFFNHKQLYRLFNAFLSSSRFGFHILDHIVTRIYVSLTNLIMFTTKSACLGCGMSMYWIGGWMLVNSGICCQICYILNVVFSRYEPYTQLNIWFHPTIHEKYVYGV